MRLHWSWLKTFRILPNWKFTECVRGKTHFTGIGTWWCNSMGRNVDDSALYSATSRWSHSSNDDTFDVDFWKPGHCAGSPIRLIAGLTHFAHEYHYNLVSAINRLILIKSQFFGSITSELKNDHWTDASRTNKHTHTKTASIAMFAEERILEANLCQFSAPLKCLFSGVYAPFIYSVWFGFD